MSETSIDHPGADLRNREAQDERAIDRLARRLVLRKLADLHGGRLTLIDDEGRHAFGESNAELDATLRVRDPRFYRRALLGGGLGVAESYTLGEWESFELPSLLRILLRNMASVRRMERGPARFRGLIARAYHRIRRNTRRGAAKNIHAHYDLGNEFFRLMLDETMTYSCGVFESGKAGLRDAQVAKYERICRRLRLSERDHVLEIGTGWGGFAIHAAAAYGCRVTTTTISKQQHDWAERRVRYLGLQDRVTVLLQDYRDLEGQYDKAVSIEMIEAVGHEYLPRFFGRLAELLAPGGEALIQAITSCDQRYERYRRSIDFIRHCIFPGSCVPSVTALCNAMTLGSDLRLSQLEDIGPHYAKTLAAWRNQFHANVEAVRSLGHPERFIRLWHYYLCYCEAGFAERYLGDAQMLLRKPGRREEDVLPELPEARAEARGVLGMAPEDAA
jgi:cyclopropane-fatty-acyl-phospholipid synthase